MDVHELEERPLRVDALFLDPNNPRFWTERTTTDVPDARIPDETIQARARSDIAKHGVEELCDSILLNGFLPLDRIVVRPIEGHSDKYVAVEGNRRLAALKTVRQRIDDGLIQNDNVPDEYLQQLKAQTETITVLVYTGTERTEIAWLLQGIRHVSGIRDWQPAQRGRLVADQVEKHRLGFREAGQRFGLSAQAVGRYYRTYKALEQMRSDDEFQTKARNDFFTLFEEAIRNKDVRQWLGWSDETYEFQNNDNLRQFYSWIVEDEQHPPDKPARRIDDPREIKQLGFLIAGKFDTLINQIDEYEVSIEEAHVRATQLGQKYDWRQALDRAASLIADIPQAAIASAPSEIIGKLDELSEAIRKVRQMAESVQE